MRAVSSAAGPRPKPRGSRSSRSGERHGKSRRGRSARLRGGLRSLGMPHGLSALAKRFAGGRPWRARCRHGLVWLGTATMSACPLLSTPKHAVKTPRVPPYPAGSSGGFKCAPPLSSFRDRGLGVRPAPHVRAGAGPYGSRCSRIPPGITPALRPQPSDLGVMGFYCPGSVISDSTIMVRRAACDLATRSRTLS